MQTNRYGFLRRILHWVGALSVLGLLAVGMLFFFFGVEGTQKLFGPDLLKYHKSFGVVVLIVGVLVLFMRRSSGIPPYDPPLTFLLRWPSKLVHWLMILAQCRSLQRVLTPVVMPPLKLWPVPQALPTNT